MPNPFNNPAFQNALSGATMSNQNRRRMNAQLETAGNTEAQRRQRENRQRRSNQMTNVARILSESGRLPPINRERLSLASRSLRTALRPNVERYFGQFRFENSGLFNGNTRNAIFRRLFNRRTNVPTLLNELNGETVTLNNNQTITKKTILSIELNSGISELSDLYNRLTYRGNVQPASKSKLIRSFISRFGDLTPNTVKLIVPHVSKHNLKVYSNLRKRYKNGNFRVSRRLRGQPAIHPGGLGPTTERRIRKVKQPSRSYRR